MGNAAATRGGHMNNEAMKEVLNDLFSHLERLETQTEAILQFLKEKKRVTDKQLAPYLEQAGNASSVRWRATRVRIEHLLSPEHPEKEVKLGKQPEMQEASVPAASSRADSSKNKRTEVVDKKEDKRTESGDAGASDKDESAPAAVIQVSPADGKEDKSEVRSESTQGHKEQTAQDQYKDEQKSDSGDFQHPTEVTEPLARQEGAEP
ncbi:MAG: hypothetical protein JWM83_1655, partial [Candidatus Angelobacter sp.]|nr:hypothetical protein [Candidatus Angelobacter sp.]